MLHQGDHRWLLYGTHRQRAKEKSSEHCNALVPSRDTAGPPQGGGGKWWDSRQIQWSNQQDLLID